MNRPWMKFYPRDWRADPRLRMCSLAARGLWADLLGYMHEAEPYGHLLIDGQQPSTEDIASLVGRPMTETRKALSELDERGVYSVTETGVIYSRRMVRDQEKAERDKANGRGGGNPRLNGGVNPQDNGGDKAQIPDARIQNPERKKDAPDGAPEDLEKQLFHRGKQVAGQNAGGLIAKLLKAKNGNVALARAVIEQASTKQNPREFIGAAIAGGNASESGKRLTNDELFWGQGRTPGIL